MDDEVAFLQAIRERPHDESTRLVFADWLEEAGDIRAEFLRVDAQLAQLREDTAEAAELRGQWRLLWDELPPVWRVLLGRTPVENCGLHLRACPQKWSDLNPTEQDGVRHCWACDRLVHYCQSMDELHAHAEQGHCVAIDQRVPYLPHDLRPVAEESGDGAVLGVLLLDDSSAQNSGSRLWKAARRRTS